MTTDGIIHYASARNKGVSMPTVEEMARGYMDNVASRITELKKQVAALEAHLAECMEEDLKELKGEGND